VGVRITRPFGGAQPWAIVVALTPLLFYLAPVALVPWYAGRGPGLGVAGALAWLLSDALTHGEYGRWSIPYWNGAVRLGALALVAEIVARLRAAAARERDQARADPRTGVATFLVPPESVDALLAAADRLMYQAKQSGKNAVAHETQNEASVLR